MDLLGVIVRLTHTASLVSLAGAFGCLLLVVRAAARAVGEAGHGAVATLDRRILILARVALGVVLAAGVLDLWRQVSVATGAGLRESLDASQALAVLLDTRYGLVWLARHGLLVLLGVFLALAEPEQEGADWLALRGQALALAAGALVLGAAAGHAAATDPAAVSLVVDAVHLLAAAVWAGGLVPLALALAWTRQLPQPAAATAAAVAAARFSRLGLVTIGTLVATGLFLGAEQLDGIPGLLGTPYGRWLALKIALVLAVLGVATGNRLVWRRRLAVGGAEALGAADRLRRRVLGEAVLAAGILAVVAVLGLTTPGRHADVAWPLPFRLDWEATKTLPGVRPRVAVGSQLVTFGLVCLLLALVVRPRRWRVAGAGGALAMLVGGAVALPPLAVDANPATYLRPTVPYTASSVVEGEALYRRHCQPCHGPSGYGDGPHGAGLPRRPADLTAQHAANHTAGDLFWWVTHGIAGSGMPGFADRLSSEERWEVVTFARALAAAERARDLGAAAGVRPAVVAPDFDYTVGVGAERTLRERRGRAVVLLVFFTLPESGDRLVQLDQVSLALRLVGGDILGVPLRDARDVYRALDGRPVYFPIAVDGAPEAAAAYTLFRRDFSAAGQRDDVPAPAHMELLVDRQGYLRARWIPRDVTRDADGWADTGRLLAQVERLARETPIAPVAAEHVH